jgi:hypothetical protein
MNDSLQKERMMSSILHLLMTSTGIWSLPQHFPLTIVFITIFSSSIVKGPSSIGCLLNPFFLSSSSFWTSGGLPRSSLAELIVPASRMHVKKKSANYVTEKSRAQIKQK